MCNVSNETLKVLKGMALDDLKRLQALPLEKKEEMSMASIKEWYEYWNGKVYLSFSGGKDSTVLLHFIRRMYPDVPAVFADTGLEYPDIRKHVKQFDNVVVVRPEKNFVKILTECGYPIISKDISRRVKQVKRAATLGKRAKTADAFEGVGKYSGLFNNKKYKPLLNVDFKISDQCCYFMKEKPMQKWGKENKSVPFIGTMANESLRRRNAWVRTGCNAFESRYPSSKPLSVWTEQDIYAYTLKYNLPLARPYGEIIKYGCKYWTTGCNRTGCTFCGFGAHIGNGERFRTLAKLEPRLYEFCLGGGAYNADGIWVPNKHGLGFKHVYDTLNALYGEDFIKYEPEPTLF